MRTLVEADGNIAAGVSRRGGHGVTVDKNSVLMVQQHKKFRMSIVGISETIWFGCHNNIMMYSETCLKDHLRNKTNSILRPQFSIKIWSRGWSY